MPTRSFQHITPPLRLFSGSDSLGRLGRELERADSQRAVIVCGASLVREGATLDLIRAAMGERCAGVFAGVRAHSPIPAIEAGVAELKRLEADAVVAVGGGSAVVTARAMNILISENADLRTLATSRDARGSLRSPKLLAPKLPLFVIPTTPNTATVKAGTAVHDPADGTRHALFDPKTRASAVFIHPAVLATAPRALMFSAALDAFVAAIEGLTSSRAGDPIADALLIHAVRLIARHLMIDGPDDDAEARTGLMLGAVLSGQGTDFTGAGLATALGHAIGASLGLENGLAKAIVMPAVLRFNGDAAVVGLSNVATALGASAPSGKDLVARVIEALAAITAALAIPMRLRDAGVTLDALPKIAAKTMGDWFLLGNARPVQDVAEVRQVLEAAY
jgi:alcohol dehydrogenase class IV